ncbi:MAG: DUF4831 family protein [Dysgonamonadaceae bacterium]|jgi:hypothetical protein|nr:DUF4831 family protein [Dysgonamonadaceae bacterium]
MKKILLIFLLLSANLSSQTRVVKMSATKSTDYGVQYFLPETLLSISAEYTKAEQKSGIYSRYAERFLGLDAKSVITEDSVTFTLEKIEVTSLGVPDTKENYLIEFKSKTTSPFVYLTEDGIICTVNADFTPSVSTKKNEQKTVKASPAVEARSALTEEYFQAGSTIKMAEIAAKRIYEIRESRNDLLTGNADNAPRDGEGMKIVLDRLESQEKALTELFTGTTSVETFAAGFEINPQTEIEKKTLFRFSRYEGIVDADDLSGIPVYINVKRAEEIMQETPEDTKRKGKEQMSIVYNVPGKASVEVFAGIKTMYKNIFQIVQFGKKQILATSLFEDKKSPVKIYFYPETGAIRQIIQ